MPSHYAWCSIGVYTVRECMLDLTAGGRHLAPPCCQARGRLGRTSTSTVVPWHTSATAWCPRNRHPSLRAGD
eukprot:scaffold44065_cov74-Phaeocystis_antarctica.AAC.3